MALVLQPARYKRYLLRIILMIKKERECRKGKVTGDGELQVQRI